MSTKFFSLKLSEKTPLPQQKNNGTPIFWVDLTFEWYEDAMVFYVFIFIFLLRTNIKKRYLNESDFYHCYRNLFETAIPKVTWSQLCSKFFLNNYETHWQQHFKRHPTIEDITVMDQNTC